MNRKEVKKVKNNNSLSLNHILRHRPILNQIRQLLNESNSIYASILPDAHFNNAVLNMVNDHLNNNLNIKRK